MGEFFRPLGRCRRSIVQFELVYKLVGLGVLTPLLLSVFRLSLRAAGLRYLDLQSLRRYLTNPGALLLILLVLLGGAVFSLVDLLAVVRAVEAARQGSRLRMQDLFRLGLRGTGQLLRQAPLSALALLIVLLPLMATGLVSMYVTTGSLASLALNGLRAKPWVLLAVIPVLLLFFAVGIRLLFSFHACFVGNQPLKTAMQDSWEFTRGRALQLAAGAVLWNLGAAAVYLLLSLCAVSLAGVIGRAFAAGRMAVTLALTLVGGFAALAFLLLYCCAVPLGVCLMSLFYHHWQGLELCPLDEEHPLRAVRRGHAQAIVLALIGAVLFGLFIRSVRAGHVELRAAMLKEVTVTAHRGASRDAPENTMPAFRAAVEAGVDYLELDVQQTADGRLIVLHDSNLKRTTGLNRPVWELSWEEISGLDAGGWFDPEFRGTPIPLLEEVLAFAREENVRLNIELKPTGHEVNFEAAVAELVRRFELTDRCVVTSQNYPTLERVKACAPELTTVYVMSVAYGDITRLRAADEFSVQHNFVTAELVRRVHQAGSRLRVWTVNSAAELRHMLALDVDDLITDEPAIAMEQLARYRTSPLVQRLVTRFLRR